MAVYCWPMKKVSFLVDGFNLYHSLKLAQHGFNQNGNPTGVKWLDLNSLCGSCLPLIGGGAKLSSIYYFSALATHLAEKDSGITERHAAYIKCLQATGVEVRLGRFKNKNVWCPACKTHFQAHEEKETDVAIAVMVLELFQRNECDTIVLISGDTDLAPSIRAATRMFPNKEIWMGFPHGRLNRELKQIVGHRSFKLKKERYAKHQFPTPYVLPDGSEIEKPPLW